MFGKVLPDAAAGHRSGIGNAVQPSAGTMPQAAETGAQRPAEGGFHGAFLRVMHAQEQAGSAAIPEEAVPEEAAPDDGARIAADDAPEEAPESDEEHDIEEDVARLSEGFGRNAEVTAYLPETSDTAEVAPYPPATNDAAEVAPNLPARGGAPAALSTNSPAVPPPVLAATVPGMAAAPGAMPIEGGMVSEKATSPVGNGEPMPANASPPTAAVAVAPRNNLSGDRMAAGSTENLDLRAPPRDAMVPAPPGNDRNAVQIGSVRRDDPGAPALPPVDRTAGKAEGFTLLPGLAGAVTADADGHRPMPLYPDIGAAADALMTSKSAAETRIATPVFGSNPQLARHVAIQISDAAAKGGERTIELTLSPVELGRVRISLTPGDGGMIVTLAAERSETLDLMRRHIDLLGEEFRDLGYGATDFSFSRDAQSERRAQTPAFLAALPAGEGETDPALAARAGPQPIILSERLDIRL